MPEYHPELDAYVQSPIKQHRSTTNIEDQPLPKSGIANALHHVSGEIDRVEALVHALKERTRPICDATQIHESMEGVELSEEYSPIECFLYKEQQRIRDILALLIRIAETLRL